MKIKFNRYVEVAILAFSLFGFAGRFWALPELTLVQHVGYFFMQFLILNLLWILYYLLNRRLNTYLPFEKGVIQRISLQLILGWLLVEGVMIPIGLYAVEHVNVLNSRSLDKLHFVFIGLTAFFGSSVMNLGFIANHFFEQWRKNAVRAANLEREKAQVQFDNLKNQLNPHFLFNSLASLDSLILDNPALARQFLQQLSKVYRYVLKSQDEGLVNLKTEMDFVSNYLSLLSIRFASHLSVELSLEEKDQNYQLVPMTLQILLENAIKHNVIDSDHPMTIKIRSQDEWMEVWNSLHRKQRVEGSNGKGLANLSSLYEFLGGRPMEIQQGEHYFSVRVPLFQPMISTPESPA